MRASLFTIAAAVVLLASGCAGRAQTVSAGRLPARTGADDVDALRVAQAEGEAAAHIARPRDAQLDYVQVLGVWEAPPSRAKYGAGGKGPFPPSWPALAVVATSEREPCFLLATATLFLAAGRDIDQDDPVSRLICHARFASPCLGWHGDFVGKWVDFGDFEPMFVSAHPCGGTAGSKVTVFHHSVSYAPDGIQAHSFGPVFDGYSCRGVYLGNVQGDRYPELMLPTPF